MIKSLFSFLLPALALSGLPAGTALAQTPGHTPHPYANCLTLGLTDEACHQQVVQAGGTPQPVLNSARTFDPVDFEGKDKYDRWYDRYVLYCHDYHAQPLSKPQALASYPNYPPMIPYGFR